MEHWPCGDQATARRLGRFLHLRYSGITAESTPFPTTCCRASPSSSISALKTTMDASSTGRSEGHRLELLIDAESSSDHGVHHPGVSNHNLNINDIYGTVGVLNNFNSVTHSTIYGDPLKESASSIYKIWRSCMLTTLQDAIQIKVSASKIIFYGGGILSDVSKS